MIKRILLGVLFSFTIFTITGGFEYLSSAEPTVVTEHQIIDEIHKDLGGKKEYVLPDGSRVDLLTATHAFEVERAHNWQEGIGQSLFYGLMTDKKPALILYMRPEDKRYYLRAKLVCIKYGIFLTTYKPGKIN